ncbi:Fic family protein [Leucothrix arctica]|nr:Fic family protein [Leucothrix arctica]
MNHATMATKDSNTIITCLQSSDESLSAQQILAQLGNGLPLRTLQYQLKKLVQQQSIVQTGKGRATKYSLPSHSYPSIEPRQADLVNESDEPFTVSAEAKQSQSYLRQAINKRKVVGYDYDFLNSYRPNVSNYLTDSERKHLKDIGSQKIAPQPAGTYAKHIMNRLLIDLSWNSSRLEGNTYSLLDSRRLIDFGQIATGHKPLEAQMILNHKDAIEFLVNSAEDISFNRYTLLNLHALLANNLLADTKAAGRLRHIPVGIEQSAFLPLEVPQLINSYFDQLLATAAAIKDPFEQSLFAMVQLPYLQAFDDVNKRVSRLAANIPLIKHNYAPLSFVEVPEKLYVEATLAVYELNDTRLLKEVFIWAYERSAERYAAVRQSLGEPDPLRLRYREALKTVVSEVLNGAMNRQDAFAVVKAWSESQIDPSEAGEFQAMVEKELLSLHEGNFARYAVRPSAFEIWVKVWNNA